MAVKLEMLRTFLVVAECGNLTEAANRVGRTPSAVSMSLKQLQEHFGKPLFESDRKSTLSAFGTFVFEQAEIEVRRFDQMISAIESFAAEDVSVIRLAAVPSVAAAILPKAIKAFLSEYPSVRVDLRDMSSTSVMGALSRHEIDIGIATIPDAARAAQRTRIYSDTFGVFCGRDHPIARLGRPVRWEELEDETVLGNELARTISDSNCQALMSRARMIVPNTTSLLAMVRDGLGITILPKLAASLGHDDIRFVQLAETTLSRNIDLVSVQPPGQSKLIDRLCSLIFKASERL